MAKLDIQSGELVTIINGVMYANELFENLHSWPLGTLFKILQNKDGVVVLEKQDTEQPTDAVMKSADWPFYDNGSGV